MVSMLRVDVALDLGRYHLQAAFDVPHGLTVLSGPSGSGKSLTLALVAGIVRPDRGIIELRGRTLDDTERALHVPSRDRHVGIVFQDALLFPHRTVLDNVALAVRDGDRGQRRERARELLERVGAEPLARARPATLSGGQRQRVSLARALATDPRLLLLDEPFSALDHDTRRQLRELVRATVDLSGIPALFVTHDPDEARQLADTIVTYRPGGTHRTITPDELTDDDGAAVIPHELEHDLRRHADRLNRPVDELVADALRDYLNRA